MQTEIRTSERKLKLSKSFVKPLTSAPGVTAAANEEVASNIFVKVCLPPDTYRQCPTCSMYCI